MLGGGMELERKMQQETATAPCRGASEPARTGARWSAGVDEEPAELRLQPREVESGRRPGNGGCCAREEVAWEWGAAAGGRGGMGGRERAVVGGGFWIQGPDRDCLGGGGAQA